MDKEYSDYCQDLADLIHEDYFHDSGSAIQFFCDYIGDGETPKMALALTKDHFNSGQGQDNG